MCASCNCPFVFEGCGSEHRGDRKIQFPKGWKKKISSLFHPVFSVSFGSAEISRL